MKWNVLLGLAVVVSALFLVKSHHHNRNQFADLEKAKAMSKELDVEWSQLQLEQTQAAKHSMIDQVARRDLQLRVVEPSKTLYLNPGESDRPVARKTESAWPEVASARR
jgi:cell division protein FtsL